MSQTLSAQFRQHRDVIARQQLTDHPPSEAVLRAFSDLDVDLTATEERLADVVDPDTVDGLFADADNHVQLSTVLWGHPVLITTDAVHVLEKQAEV